MPPDDDDGGDGSGRYVLVVVPVPNQPVFAVPGIYWVSGLEKYLIINIDRQKIKFTVDFEYQKHNHLKHQVQLHLKSLHHHLHRQFVVD